jgi:hypothetical protein
MNWRTNVVLTVPILGVRTPPGQDALWVGRILRSNTAVDPSLGSLPGRRNRNDFRPSVPQTARRLRSARQCPNTSRSKSSPGVCATILTISRTAAKGGIPLICALARDWPHGGSAAKAGRSTPRDPAMGTREQPSVLQARPAAACWRPIAKWSGSRTAGLALRAEDNAHPCWLGGQRAMPLAHFATGGGRRRPRLTSSGVAASVVITRGGAPLEAS